MFDPLAYPYVRAATFVDPNPPEVLSDAFYNPSQDALGMLYGAYAGYSASLSYEEFTVNQPLAAGIPGYPFGSNMAVTQNTATASQFASVAPDGPNQHGVFQISGVADGGRGGPPGFIAGDSPRWVGTKRWIFRARLRCRKHSVLTGANPGLVIGLGVYSDGVPVWLSNGSGFWIYKWDGGVLTSAIPTVDGQWVNLWITLRDADGMVRWYLKRDSDPLPILIDTQTLVTASLINVRRSLSYMVTPGAVSTDNVQVDTMSLAVER